MIVSIGTDIIEVSRIREILKRTPRFKERVFTEKEILYCEQKGVSADQSFAVRFAAKEAALKALRTGWRGKISWHDFEILNDETGFPTLNIKGEAKKIFESLKARSIHLSLAHTKEYAVATVIFENS